MIEGPAKAEWDAANELAETVPTTMTGVLALLLRVDEATENDSVLSDERIMPALLSSLAKAAKALWPQAGA